jgi:DNA-binding transcriptional MerR regulator
MTQEGDPAAALERRLVRLEDRPLTVTAMAKLVGIVPGPWTLRRMESRGVIPPAKRSLARGDRYYDPGDADRIRRAILERLRRLEVEK